MNRSTVWMIKYMNGSVFSKVRYMNGVGLEILARTPVPKLPPKLPPPPLPHPGPEVIKLFSCSTQLSMKFSLLIDMKMPTIVGIFISISRELFMLSYV